ncbi:MAG: leucine-rich repeat domain-containing protein [Chloroflexi bacterium]|nr:leucine-rich repeat domain-containing protein [Chloroflexota bacterium]
MIRTMMLIPMFAALLACGLMTSTDNPTEESERNVEVFGEVLAAHYGDTSIEQKILDSNPIVKATMTSLSSEVIEDADGKYAAILKFNLDVSEYLKGNGPSSIVAIWIDGRSYDTRSRAEDAMALILSERDDQWDDREAVIFMFHGASGFGPTLEPQIQLADHFYFALGHQYFKDDRYSLHSTRNKIWLPAASGAGSTGDAQEFLLDVPPPTATALTITLDDLKARIAAVAAELDERDGSDAVATCVREKYELERVIRYFRDVDGIDAIAEDRKPQDSSLASGQPANTQMHQRLNAGLYPDQKAKTWLEGMDADLFTVVQGEPTAVDFDGDGSFTAGSDGIEFTEIFATARPLPVGEYEIVRKEVWGRYVLCDYVLSHDWTIPAVAPEDTLHEAFFDPVTDGTAVAADDTNGVLKPAAFTDADGAAATLERIEWESGMVEFELSSDDSLAGQVVNFIELDGSVSLSLNADDATVDSANDTLSWPVASQPWEDGDKLMLRIREARGTCWNGTAVPNLSANPGLASDCTTLLAAKDALRGTATLNWSADTAITSWDGVTVKGTPSRVVEIILTDKSLDGTIPAELAKLTGLQSLHLYENQLTGSIPTEFGSLTALTDLRLYSNRLSGGIPTELGSLTRLVVLYLDDNQLTGAIPSELGSLSNLRDLFLTGNRLTGSIPTQLGSLTTLRFMNLDGNQLTGAIPTQLGSLTNLQDLSLSGNRLTDSIPTQLGDLTKLRDLFLNDNQLTGSIPAQIGKLANLETLDLSGNGLTGAIPSELGKLSKLESLYLRNNQLTGAIPAQLATLSNLDTLRLFGNTLTGCIPSALRNVDDHDLARLRLQYCAAP